MINELDTVVLTRDLPGTDLRAGDVGAVVHVYPGASAFEVEFVAGDGSTIAVATLESDSVRLRRSSEVLHVRDTLASAA
jgi:hypothetical protein